MKNMLYLCSEIQMNYIMNLTFIKTTELNVKLKCSIQASGKLGFTDATPDFVIAPPKNFR